MHKRYVGKGQTPFGGEPSPIHNAEQEPDVTESMLSAHTCATVSNGHRAGSALVSDM
jgi:hypothetical protein